MDADNALVKAKDSSNGLARQEWPARAFSEEKKGPHSMDYWRVLVRHRWIVLACFLVTVISVAVATFMQQPVYKATATIKIDRAELKVLKFDDASPLPDSETDSYYQTQYKLLTSYSLAERVVKRLNLDTNPEFSGTGTQGPASPTWTWFTNLIDLIRPRPSMQAASGETSTIESPVVQSFLNRLNIEPVKNTRLVKIAFLSASPELSAQIANAMAENFIEQSIEQRLGAMKYAGDFLAKQIQEVRIKLESSDELLQKFATQKQYLVLDEKQEQTTKQLSLLTDALMKARSERLAKEALYRQTQGQDFQSLPSVLENSLIAGLKTEYFRLQAEYRKLSSTFLPDYPRMVALKSNIEEVKVKLDSEVQKIVDGLRSSYEAGLKSEHLLQSAVDKQKIVTLKTNEDSIQYNILKREVDINRELYAGLLQRMKETAVSAGLDSTNIQVTDPAKVPLGRDSPKRLRNLTLGIVLGLSLGIGLAFFADYLDNTVNKIEEVESTFVLPILGIVPALASVERRKRLKGTTNNGQETKSFELAMYQDQFSLLSEAIRNIRTSLLFSLPENPPKLLLVTSAEPGDGKTGVSINLSIALSQLGGDVLLIDADMRYPDCHRILGQDRTPGLSNFLVGDAELSAAIKPTTIPHLYLLPAGQSPLNPTELISSERMKVAMELLCQQFKHVIIDAPPVLGFSDSVLLSTFAEGTLFVIRAGKTVRDAAQRALRMLNAVNAKILGVVLNHLDLQSNGYSYYQDHRDYYHRKSEHHGAMASEQRDPSNTPGASHAHGHESPDSPHDVPSLLAGEG
ncbi:MAG TPA: polysaccharide biosynthesis tyrosine autokinase [Patescibacteria group bacterium]|nr:polysaccharide biosynthesis tyrosine autokinase [Patescibacteria group bacterium]